MKYKGGVWKRVLVMLVVIILNFTILTPEILGKSNLNSENKLVKSNPLVVRMINNIFGKIFSNRAGLLSMGLLYSYINSNCDGVEKTTQISIGSTTEIDVDNNTKTGNENGADIKVQYYIDPWIEISTDIGVGLIFSLYITRLGDGINNSDLKIDLGVGNNTIKLGYWSPRETGNENPGYITIKFKIFFYLFKQTKGFNLNIEPIYNNVNQNKKIELYAECNSDTVQRKFSIGFEPAITTDISFISKKKQGVWQYELSRGSNEESKVTIEFTTNENDNNKETTLIIDKLPKELSFSLGLTPFTEGGGQFSYESDTMYNIELQINSNELGNCKYAFIRNTPRKILAEWTPTLSNGDYHIKIDSNGTDFILKDNIDNPYINLEVDSLKTINVDAYWNLTNPGDFTVYKNNDINISLDFKIGEWIAQLSAQPIAKYVSTSWLIATSGYLSIDTNGEPFATIDLLVRSPNLGLETIGEGYRAQEFRINWTVWPPQEWDLTTEGWIDYNSVNIDIYLFNSWYHLWPW